MDATDAAHRSAAMTATRYKILVINDAPEFLTFMREFLTVEGGFEVATLDQSEGAVKQATNDPPDLIVLDIVFRYGPSGLQVAESLSITAETANIPVLFCTALSPREVDADTQELAAARNQRILYKPFDLDELLRNINELLEHTYGEPTD
jgi:two-component system OmpR family response regulator